jgi:hypothetical protein
VLSFAVTGARAGDRCLAPEVRLGLAIATRPERAVHALLLRYQVRIDAGARRDVDEAALIELFGHPSRLGHPRRDLLWVSASTVVPGFVGTTELELPLPCTFDFEVAATKLFYALREGEVTLRFLPSGSVFSADPATGALAAAPIPHALEATYRMPVLVWRQAIDRCYPGHAVVGMRRELFERLCAVKRERGLPTLERALEEILP